MRILVTGATGFVGSQIVTDLLLKNNDVICCARNIQFAKKIFPQATFISCDFNSDITKATWMNRLKDIDIVINTVGIFYHPNKTVIWNIHSKTPRALFEACVKAKVKFVIQISALGIANSNVDYALSKKDADDFLMSLEIPSIILRPSFIYGRGSYGGSSLFRALSALPGFILLPGNGSQLLQPIHIQDLSQAIINLIEKQKNNYQSGKSEILEAVSQKKISLQEILLTLRNWLGFHTAKIIQIPISLIKIFAIIGNYIPYSTINSPSVSLLLQNNVTNDENTKKFADTIGFTPQNFIEGVYSYPSSVQDRWHARLYFLKPTLRITIALLWIVTAIVSAFFYPTSASYALLSQVGVSETFQPFMLYGASLVDALLGLAMLFNFQLKKTIYIQIAIILLYTLIISVKLPFYWLEPFGPITKNFPLLISLLILLAMEPER